MRSRDRYIDAIRVGSLLVVVVGHWLMGVVGPDGRVSNALLAVPAMQPLTWLFQVMPLFFLVGGMAHAYALDGLERRSAPGPGRYAAFVRKRAQRLLRPTLVLLAVWLGWGLVLRATGVLDDGPRGLPDHGSTDILTAALRLVTQPLWFVGIYLAVAAMAPALFRAHRRWGPRVVVACVTAAVVVDLLRFAGGVEAVGSLNYALVWVGLHQLGFCWHSGELGRREAMWLLTGGSAALVAAVTVGPYPVSLVGLPGEPVSNMAPPTVALLAQGLALAGAAVLLRGPGTRVLSRPRVWRAVVTLGATTMTAYLWHLTALFVAVLGLRFAGVLQPPTGSAAWWATRLPWLLLLAALTAGLVAVFRRFDVIGDGAPRGEAAPSRAADTMSAAGAALAALGVLLVSLTGVDLLGGRSIRFLVVDVAPVTALVVLGAGCLALGSGGDVLARQARPGHREQDGDPSGLDGEPVQHGVQRYGVPQQVAEREPVVREQPRVDRGQLGDGVQDLHDHDGDGGRRHGGNGDLREGGDEQPERRHGGQHR